MLVFVPLSPLELPVWAKGGELADASAFAATPTFLTAFGIASPDHEDAERTALYVAGLAGLLRHGVRLVAVAEDARARDLGDDFGAVSTARLPYHAVTALFADAPEAALQGKDVRAELGERPLDQAWEHAAHRRLLAEADLLWHGPGEWGRLAR